MAYPSGFNEFLVREPTDKIVGWSEDIVTSRISQLSGSVIGAGESRSSDGKTIINWDTGEVTFSDGARRRVFLGKIPGTEDYGIKIVDAEGNVVMSALGQIQTAGIAFGSVNFKHLVQDNILISTCFDTFDGWDAGGLKTVHVFDSDIHTTAVVNNTSWVQLYTEQFKVELDPTKNPYFQTTVYFSSAADQEAYIGLGMSAGGPDASALGFKVVDDALYACWYGGGAERTQIIGGITITDAMVLRAYCDSDAEEIYFYVNGVLKYTATTNYPTGTNNIWFIYWIKTTATAVKYLFLVDLHLMQDR